VLKTQELDSISQW